MARITFELPDGDSLLVDANPGQSLMDVATNANVSGIEAECGGCCTCCTCHVVVAMEWLAHLPQISANESELLEFAPHRDEQRSRLSCQLPVTDAMDGMVVFVPREQA